MPKKDDRDGETQSTLPASARTYWADLFSIRPRINETLPPTEYLLASLRTLDGVVCLISLALSFAAIADLLFGGEFFPLKYREDFGKALVILIFSPALLFFLMVRLRQYLSAQYKVSEIFRALALASFFFFLNFGWGK
jgi:hypothetical protein